jgi:hypothetical protein
LPAGDGTGRIPGLMENRLGLVIAFAVVAGSAALVAFTLGYVAHYGIGPSRMEIRHSA